ncbi:hypothetical protein JHW43_009431 [Diplocarpon mali]|nr:hypothetical protein JHW43_009431 [Diplocarpon mali]
MATLPLLTASLTALSLPAPTPSFLQPILQPANPTPNSQRSTPPLAALTATAKHRLLSASISSSPSILLPSTPALPPGVADARVRSRALAQDVFVQVLDVQDAGRSRWEQVERLESERRGEAVKGREVIRAVPADGAGAGDDDAGPGTQSLRTPPSRGPLKLLLQDCKGATVWGFELRNVEKLGVPPAMGIGCKILLKKGIPVARGMVLLEPGSVLVFGGRIDGLDKAWREGREARLRREVEGRDGEE